MQFSTSVLSGVLLMACTAMVGAVPQGHYNERSLAAIASSLFAKRDQPQSQTLALPNYFAHKAFQKCKELGIDPYGKAPKDFDWDDGKAISFKAESDYALWIAAQNARTDHGNTKRGVNSNIDVVLWDTKDCTPGNGLHLYDLVVAKKYWDGGFHRQEFSLQISRGIVNGDILRIWLQKWYGGTSRDCHDVGNPNHYIYGGPGCAGNLPQYDCVVIMPVS
ncbi:hypothetical protein K440DRAFT_629944 [Wilcoxina mikolae CBS 423.85]|nr:hypothetical protein K440DRAFT_629944 [Wilcoxina mikolae CBS 423.85]